MSFPLLVLFLAGADLGERDLQAAVQASLRGDLDEAATLYQSLVDRGHGSADLFYNLGTTELERGRTAAGVAALASALRRDPGHQGAQGNLEVSQPTAAEAEPTFVEAARPLSGALSFTAWFATAAVANALFVLALALRGGRRWLALSASVLLGLPAAAALGARHLEATRDLVVASGPVGLRNGPAERFATRSELSEGELVRVTQREASWIEVRTRDGRTGWLSVESTLPVPPVRLIP